MLWLFPEETGANLQVLAIWEEEYSSGNYVSGIISAPLDIQESVIVHVLLAMYVCEFFFYKTFLSAFSTTVSLVFQKYPKEKNSKFDHFPSFFFPTKLLIGGEGNFQI